MMATAGSTGSRLDLPLVRTLRSTRFRLLVALLLLLCGIGFNYLYVTGQLARGIDLLEDFGAYFQASRLLLDGSSPYSAAQLAAPIDAVCVGCYLYPPVLAQVITPLALLRLPEAIVAWFAALSVAAFGAVWLGAEAGGARRSLERGVWSLTAVSLFLPAIKAIWVGNVSSMMALGVALTAFGGVIAGIAVGLGALVKLVSGAFVPAVFLEGCSSRRSLVATVGVAGAVLFLLAPQAWLDYLTVLPNLIAGAGDVRWNLAPATMADRAGFGAPAVGLIRVATIMVGVAAIAASGWVSWRRGAMPAAVALATLAMLLIPGTLWDHYLVVLLPVAAMAWPRAGIGGRIVLLAPMVVVSLSLVLYAPAVTFVAAMVVLGSSTWLLWPRGTDK